MSEIPKITVHCYPEKFCAPGMIQVLCAPKDYITMRNFFAEHTEVFEFASGPMDDSKYFVKYTPIRDEE